LWFRDGGDVTRADYADLVTKLISDGTHTLRAQPRASSKRPAAAE
jgi:TetR/AcrR family transcriptional regulator